MDDLKELSAARGLMLPVTQWHEEWLAAGAVITEEAVDTVFATAKHDYLRKTRDSSAGRMRPSMFSSSCPRAHALSYMGFPQGARIRAYDDMAHAGSMQHYDWQIMGLSAGWLTEIEVRLEIPKWRMRGQCDGRNKDGSVAEFKTIGTDKFNGLRGQKAVVTWKEPKREFVLQSHCYMEATGADKCSIIAINRDNGEYREFRIERDPEVIAWMDEFFELINMEIDAENLPEMLEGCWHLVNGYEPSTPADVVKAWQGVHRWCNFKDVCPTATYADGIPF